MDAFSCYKQKKLAPFNLAHSPCMAVVNALPTKFQVRVASSVSKIFRGRPSRKL